MPPTKPQNPFYAGLVVVGLAFGLTACAYVVMVVRGSNPHTAGEGGLVGVMERHGAAILLVEIVLLGLLTLLAIGTDEYWSRQASQSNTKPNDSLTPSE